MKIYLFVSRLQAGHYGQTHQHPSAHSHSNLSPASSRKHDSFKFSLQLKNMFLPRACCQVSPGVWDLSCQVSLTVVLMSMLRGVTPHTISVVTSCKYVDIHWPVLGPRCEGTVLVIVATVTATVHCSAWKALAMTQVARARISNVISIHNTFLCQQSVFWKYPLLMNFISRHFKHRQALGILNLAQFIRHHRLQGKACPPGWRHDSPHKQCGQCQWAASLNEQGLNRLM